MKFFMLLLLTLLSFTAHSKSPFQPHDHKRFLAIENKISSESPIYKNVLSTNFVVSSTLAASSTHDLDMFIPAGSIITNVYTRVGTLVVSANDNTLALGCVTANDLSTANDYSGDAAGSFRAGVQTGAAANHLKLAADCVPKWTVGAGASGVTAGEIEVYVEYVIGK